MTDTPAEIKIFYSWQSDLPDSTNKSALRHALRTAANSVEQSLDSIRAIIDEATRDRPGSPNIPATILEKIENSDVVVADVSIISKEGNDRRCPNPNVVFELGFAVAHLGWNRIILVFNEGFGALSELPFDFDRHRVARYSLSEDSNKDDQKKVSGLLKEALLSIIKTAPKRPLELRGQSVDHVKRSRDLDNLGRALSAIHIPSLQEHSEDYPYRILDIVEYCWLRFDEIVRSAHFHIYDNELDVAVRALHSSWARSLAHSEEYHPNSSNTAYIFMRYDDPAYMMHGDHQKHWDEMNTARNELRADLHRFLTVIRERYHEIDIRALSDARFDSYRVWREKLKSDP